MLFRVLGPLEVRRPDGRAWETTAERHRILLALLLSHANDWVDVDEIVAVLWPDGAPATAASNVRTAVHHLRQSLPRTEGGTPRINGQAGAYRLNVAVEELDAAMFVSLTAQGRAALAAGDAPAAVERLSAALALWRGDPFEPASAAAVARTAELDELRWLARDALADALLAADRPADAVDVLWPLSDLAPLREPTWHRLVTALEHDGHPDQALAVCEQFIAAPGGEPSAAMLRLHRQLLGEDDGHTMRIKPGAAGLPYAERQSPASSDQPQPIDLDEPAPVVPPLGDLRLGRRPDPPRDADPAAWVPGARAARPDKAQDDSTGDPRRKRLVAALLAVVAVVVVGGIVLVNQRDQPETAAPGPQSTSQTSQSSQTTQPPPVGPQLPEGVSPRRQIPGLPGPGAGPALLFGAGDQADATMRSGLVDGTEARLLSTRFTGGSDDDVTRLAIWRDSVVPQAYGSGYALHLVVADGSQETTFDTTTGPVCGRPYALSPEFLADVELLATAFAGPADGPPLFVTLFEGVQGFACQKGAYRPDEPTRAYYDALAEQYRKAREAFHRVAPNALVSLGWDAGQASHDTPATEGGVSMIRHFAELIRWSDFATASAAQPSDNVEHIRAAVRELGQYAPVLLSYGPSAAFAQDLPVMVTDEFLAEVVGNGLFAMTFYGDTAAETAARPVADAIARYGRPAR